MTRLTLFAAAAVLTTALATPVTAQQMSNPGWNGPDRSYSRDYRHERGPRHDRGFESNAFWPADVAAGVVGGALGTAGAIAAAPFGGPDQFAYDESYAKRNGFVCQPGTLFRGSDGRMHPCQ
ncbi:hypothetical protein [Rhodopseudomonas palustris]|uniref:Lectin-like protein BA14k n=1 Tax=Rhodopseudomonas palustris (strain BisB18) TaxID=316056 RepID=Q214S2_RHOPB